MLTLVVVFLRNMFDVTDYPSANANNFFIMNLIFFVCRTVLLNGTNETHHFVLDFTASIFYECLL